jgi:hypothetical protein
MLSGTASYRARGNLGADLLKAQVHAFDIGGWGDDRRANCAVWTDGAEDIGTVVGSVANLADRSAWRRFAGDDFGGERVMIDFKRSHFERDVILWAVR